MYMIKKFLTAIPPVPAAASASILMAWNSMPPDFRGKELEMELKYRNRNRNDPDRPPRRRPGDGYTILGAIAGLIAGFILGGNSNSLLMFIVFFIGGGIVGTILGSFVRPLINRLKQSRTKKSEEQQGPFA